MSESGPSGRNSRVTFDEPERPVTTHANMPPPPAYGDEGNSALALPVNRLSESSRSDGSADHGVYATTTTTHTISTTTTFFRLSRKKKPGSLFPLPPRINPVDNHQAFGPPVSSFASRTLGVESPAVAALRRPTTAEEVTSEGLASPLPSPSHSALARTSMGFAATPGAPLIRQESSASARSSHSRSRPDIRGRSSTLSSLHNVDSQDALPTPTLPSASTRTSTSTGRKSFGDLFGLSHRLRQNSEPFLPRSGSGPATPVSSTSKKNSMQMIREPIVMPERHADDTPAKYLVRLEEAVSRGVVASVLSKGTDPFSQAVLRSYMRGFGFFGDPMDMAIRKLLMEVELPKETQQIDRCLQSFADRYHECNPGIYASPENAYFIAFSLLILHTDVFNKNNKHKMQKADYLKNTRGEGVFDEILECFYDNISYTPFIHVEDDVDINGERIIQHKMKKKSIFPRGSPDPTRRGPREPIDPYTLIIDGKLNTLRPNLKDVMHLEEHYSYLGTAKSLDLRDLQNTFFKTGVLQIVSARSRPDAFMTERTLTNPDDAHPGIVDIKITKVGLLWRKDAKKKKTRSPWQEWGAILTGAQLYFFRNTTWIKNLMHQEEAHKKEGHEGIPVIFKPPLESFKPDALMSTDDAVALLDSTYKKHKNAFVFVRHGGFEETFLADNEDEMNDWLAKLNYAAAFRTSGVRMRGVVGGNYEGQRSRGIRRLDSNASASQSIQTPSGEVTIVSGKIDTKMAQDILAARREIMMHKIAEAEEKLVVAQKQLDSQLRNARHLQILSPIQPKTREQVVMAAGRMAAKLKWVRMEIWRLRCHRDILSLDLEEERLHRDDLSSRHEAMSPRSSDKASLSRLESKTSNVTGHTQGYRSPSSSTLTARSPTSETLPDDQHGLGDLFLPSPPLERTTSFHRAQASWELPPLSLEANTNRRSISSAGPTSPSLAHASSRASMRPEPTSDNHEPPATPGVDAAERAVLEEAGLVDIQGTPESKRLSSYSEAEKEKDRTDSAGKDKHDRSKIRRSLHRTLREAHVPTPHHHRRGKGKESSSSNGLSFDDPSNGTTEDVLSRGTGSFTIGHGKKASVIHLGSEIQSMSPEERLRLRKQALRDESGMTSPGLVDGGFDSAIAEPVVFHRRTDSGGTTSTATARSFRDVHSRLSIHGHDFRPGSSSTVGSEKRPSFEDASPASRSLPKDEDDMRSDGSSPDRSGFYTPEIAASPLQRRFPDGVARPDSQVLGFGA
jgi:hypothetical protein